MYFPTTAIFTLLFWVDDALHEFLPVAGVRRWRYQAKQITYGVIQLLLLEHQGHLVNRVIHIARFNDRL